MPLKSVLASFLAPAMLANERHLFSTIPPSLENLPHRVDVLNENWYGEGLGGENEGAESSLDGCKMRNEKSSFEAFGFLLCFFKGAGSNVCKLGDKINERGEMIKKN